MAGTRIAAAQDWISYTARRLRMFDNELLNYQTNTFGDQYLYAVNRDTFTSAGSDAVFQSHYQDRLFDSERFYIIAGTDSGLLVNWVIRRGIPDDTRYLFVEDANILAGFGTLPAELDNKLAICGVDDWEKISRSLEINRYAYHNRIILDKSLGVAHAYYPPYSELWRSINSNVSAYRWHIGTILSSQYQMRCKIMNLTENLSPALPLKNSFSGQSALLLAGGPSLDQYLPWIKQNQDKYLVVAVSRICQRLAQAGITPDIIVSIDPYPLNLLVSKDMLQFQGKSLFVNASHISPELLQIWGHQKLYIGERYPWKSTRHQDNIPAIGHTVTNVAYTLLVEMGVRKIVLLGVNFCFSQDGYSHAVGSLEYDTGPKLMLGEQRVPTNVGGYADTTNGYFLAAQELKREVLRAREHGCITINPAADAMQIEGIDFIPLEKADLTPLNRPACDILAEKVNFPERSERLKAYKDLYEEIRIFLQEILDIRAFTTNAINLIKQIPDKTKGNQREKLKRRIDVIEHTLNTRYALSTEFVKKFGIRRFISIVRSNSAKQRTSSEVEQATRAYYLAYVYTAIDIINLLKLVMERIQTRIMENAEHPDVQQLLTRWQAEQQVSRSKGWRTDNPNADIDQFLATFQAYDNLFEDRLRELAATHLHRQTQKSQLSGIQSKALEFLDDRNIQGLEHLLAGISKHTGADQALISLINAYILELQGNEPEAIAEYRKMQGKAYAFEAIRRQVSIYLNKQDYNNTAESLGQLAEFSPTYLPYYADMLHLLGKSERAVEIYTDYILSFKNDLHAVFKLGKIYTDLGMDEGTQWTMNYILEQDPQNQAATDMLATLETKIIRQPRVST